MLSIPQTTENRTEILYDIEGKPQVIYLRQTFSNETQDEHQEFSTGAETTKHIQIKRCGRKNCGTVGISKRDNDPAPIFMKSEINKHTTASEYGFDAVYAVDNICRCWLALVWNIKVLRNVKGIMRRKIFSFKSMFAKYFELMLIFEDLTGGTLSRTQI